MHRYVRPDMRVSITTDEKGFVLLHSSNFVELHRSMYCVGFCMQIQLPTDPISPNKPNIQFCRWTAYVLAVNTRAVE